MLLSHTFQCFLFDLVPAYKRFGQHLFFFFDGHFAVHIFFVVSGFSLSIGYLRKRSIPQLKNISIRRYFRLFGPIFVSCLAVFFLINAGLMFNREVFKIFPIQWIDIYYRQAEVPLSNLFSFTLYNTFFDHPTARSFLYTSLNGVLWTMPVEFSGSIAVFLSLFVLGCWRYRIYVYILLCCFFFTFKSLLLHFFLGILLAELYVAVPPGRGGRWASVISLGSTALLLCLIFGHPLWRTAHLSLLGLNAAAIVLCTYYSRPALRLFETGALKLLGRLSFPLYLVHLPIICSLTSYTLIRAHEWGLGPQALILLVGGGTVVAAILVAQLFYPVEKHTILWCKRALDLSKPAGAAPLITQAKFPRLWLVLQKLLGGTKDKQKLATRAWNGESRILEIGCSVGNISEAFLKRADASFTGIDIDEAAIEVAKKRFAGNGNFRFLTTSVAEHAGQDITYDYILVAGMLHHVDDETAGEILRSTKKLAMAGAKVVIYEPDALRTDDNLLFKAFYRLEQGRFLRRHEDLKELLRASGLRIEQEERHPVRPGFPGLPVVARFSYFVATWDAVDHRGV